MADIAQLSIRIDSLEAKVAEQNLKKLGDTSGWLESMLAKLSVAFAGLAVGAAIKEVTQLAARFETMEVVMDRAAYNAGYTGRQMRELEAALQDTGISMLESRNSLVQLATAHIDLSRAAEMARAAQNLASVAGVNSSEAFQRMIHGIKSGQTEVLRTLGLNVQFEEGYKRLAKELHTTTQALTGQQKMQARVNETMKEAAAYEGIYEAAMGTAGKQAKSMERYLENLKVQLGQVFQPIYAGAVSALSDALKVASLWAERNKNRLDALGLTLEQTRQAFGELWGTVTKGKTEIQWLEMMRGAIGGIGMALAFVSDGFKVYKLMVADTMSFLFESLARGAEALNRFYAAMPGGSTNAKMAANLMDYLAGVGVKYDSIANKTLAASSAVDTWMKKNQEIEKIAKDGKVNGDLPNALDRAGKVQIDEPPEVKASKEIGRLIEKLQEEAATYGMTKTAVEAYRASQMGMTKAQEDQVKSLLDSIDAREWEAQRVADSRREEAALTDALEQQTRARVDLLLAQRKQHEDEVLKLTEQMQTPEEKRMADILKLNALMQGGGLSMQTYQRRLMEIEKTGIGAFATLIEAVDLFGQHGADAFTQMAMTGKFAWKDMINSIIQDLIRLQSQKAFLQLSGYLTSLFPTGAAGTWGGQVSTPAGGEGLWTGYSTIAAGGSMPAVASGGKGLAAAAGGIGSMAVTVNVSGETASVSTENAGALGKRMAVAMKQTAMQTLIDEKRPGGLLWAS